MEITSTALLLEQGQLPEIQEVLTPVFQVPAQPGSYLHSNKFRGTAIRRARAPEEVRPSLTSVVPIPVIYREVALLIKMDLPPDPAHPEGIILLPITGPG